MKVLFLLILLANLFVALWEFKYGNAYITEHSPAQTAQESAPGMEKIELAGEIRSAAPDTESRPVNPAAGAPAIETQRLPREEPQPIQNSGDRNIPALP